MTGGDSSRSLSWPFYQLGRPETWWRAVGILTLLATAPAFSQTLAGPKPFQAHCAGCHGLDARGGEHGPDLVNMPHPRARTADGLKQIIQNGLIAGGMPA